MADKYDFGGIGRASATLIFSLLVDSPLAFLTVGPVGQVTFYLLTKLFSHFANQGLVLFNIGISNVQTMAAQKDFDETMKEALDAVKNKSALTDAEKKAIDDKVIAAFDKFTDFGVRSS